MKFYFFKPEGWMGKIICRVTKSEYCHVAIEINGKMYDSSENRGNFAEISRSILEEREWIGYEITTQQNMEQWVDHMMGTKYDWRGVIGWVFNLNDKTKFYCFEAGWNALKWAKLAGNRPDYLDADKLIEKIQTMSNMKELK